MSTTQTPQQDTRTWPELAIGLYDKLTGRNAEITYEFKDFGLGIPSSAAPSADKAQWQLNGTLKIRTRDNVS